MLCEYDGCTQACRSVTSDTEDVCNVLRAYRKGKADEREKFDKYMRIKCHVDVSEYLGWYEKEQKNG